MLTQSNVQNKLTRRNEYNFSKIRGLLYTLN